MKKKRKEKDGYNFLEDIKKNPQKKARISLILWIMFFLTIILFTRNIPKKYQVNKQNNISSYEYTYSNDKITIFGKISDKTQLFTILNDKYYYDGEDVYKVDGHNTTILPMFDLGILKVDIALIEKLTMNSNYTSENEYKRYLVPLSEFINLFDYDTDVNLSSANDYNIIIDKYYKNDELSQIKVDLGNYYKYKNIENDGIINIYLYNINKVGNELKEYSDMIGGV